MARPRDQETTIIERVCYTGRRREWSMLCHAAHTGKPQAWSGGRGRVEAVARAFYSGFHRQDKAGEGKQF